MRNKMKVHTITLHASHNYGAMLQAFALRESVASLGHECSVIDYRPDAIDSGNHRIKKTLRPKPLYFSLRAAPHWLAWRNRHRAFERFRIETMNQTRCYRTEDELKGDPPESDLYLCGSDQIWNPERPFRSPYFLGFGGEQTKRASYAASFGVSEAPEDKLDELKRRLLPFQGISVREKEGQAILARAGLDSDLVVDPTLLLGRDEWARTAAAYHGTGDYILVYCLQHSADFDLVLKRLSDSTGLPVYRIPGSTVAKTKPIHRVMRSAGPREFLGLFRKAAYVVTNSFHGTAFALNMGRPLVGVAHTNRNSRMTSVLDQLGWPDSQVNQRTPVEEVKEIAQERASQVDEHAIANLRADSLKFLETQCS